MAKEAGAYFVLILKIILTRPSAVSASRYVRFEVTSLLKRGKKSSKFIRSYICVIHVRIWIAYLSCSCPENVRRSPKTFFAFCRPIHVLLNSVFYFLFRSFRCKLLQNVWSEQFCQRIYLHAMRTRIFYDYLYLVWLPNFFIKLF